MIRSQGQRPVSAVMSQHAADFAHLVRIHVFTGLILLFLAIVVATSAHAVTEDETGEPIVGPAINKIISGRRIYLSVPFSGEMPLFYRKDGYVDGSGEAVGLGKFIAPQDSGKWWVDGSRLCQQWSQWYGGKVFCFTLEKLSNDRLIWRRDDGEEGIARIGD